jgi:hypothetical protein
MFFGFVERKVRGSNLIRLSENAKSENFGVDIKGFMTRKSVEIPILGQPVIY